MHGSPHARSPAVPVRPAFTVMELLVVIAIIAILLTLGIGGWNQLVGRNSVEAGQNLTSAYLGRAREEAMAQRKLRGVVLFERQGQVLMATVYPDDPATRPNQLEIMPETDIQPLQSGVGARFINNTAPRYSTPGVLLFDGYGQVHMRGYTIRATGKLGKLMELQSDLSGMSHLGVTLYETNRYEREGMASKDPERWLDTKGRSLFVNRYSGTLVEGRAN